MALEDVFSGKVAIVTGAGRGIGRALAKALLDRGSTVVLVDHDQASLQNCLSDFPGLDEGCVIHADVRDGERMRQVVEDVASRFGRLDFLFNNAGIGITAETHDTELGDWEEVIDTNLLGVIHGTLPAYKIMVNQGFGHIVNISSALGMVPFPVCAPYTASKFGVYGLSMSLHYEARDRGVSVSVVCPGFVRTEIWRSLRVIKLDVSDWLDKMSGKMISAESAVDHILRGVESKRAVIKFPHYVGATVWLYHFMPRLFSVISRHLLHRFRKQCAR